VLKHGEYELLSKRVVLIFAPFLVLATTYLVFWGLVVTFGVTFWFGAGVLFYWIAWCTLFPLWIVGRRGLGRMYAPPTAHGEQMARISGLLLAVPPLMYLGVFILFATLPQLAPELPLPTLEAPLTLAAAAAAILGVLLVAVINGNMEEILWRGTYTTVFKGHHWWGYIYPAIMFGLWHISPFTALMADVSMIHVTGLILIATIFGLCWGYSAWHTGSIRGAVSSHTISNVLHLALAAHLLL
jgi:membrane protease YdiL (CAAX protease family)